MTSKKMLKAEFTGDNTEVSKHIAPAPENVKPNVWYTLTLSPPDMINTCMTDDEDKLKRMRSMQSEVHGIILKYQKYADVILTPELSKSSRLHWHGVIRFKDIFYSYALLLPRFREIGATEIDTIKLVSDDSTCEEGEEDHLAKWYSYCTKGYHLLPLDILDTFNNIPVEVITPQGNRVKCRQTQKKRDEFI